LLVFDEIQAGFGRTGRLFGFEHYGVVPDLMCCGKGISSSLPVAAVIGRSAVMDLYGPTEMTSTHTGNPVCAAAALASVRKVVEGGLVENARRMGEVLLAGLAGLRARHPRRGKEPDGDLAFAVVERAFQKGLLLFAPVGFGGATLKVAPPLTITPDAVHEGLAVVEEAIAEAMAPSGRA
jgi:4-aminobutyrate aminotransferase/diaminobutyrate-pyruvate transaminase/4-aminobutyrate aminotransferase/(S)-3-amino-2-methylpropionate transaminase